MRVCRSVAETGSRVAGPIDKLTRRVNRHTAGVRVMRSREVRVVCRMWQVGMRVCRHCEWITLVIHLHFHSKSASDYLQHWISIHLPLYNPSLHRRRFTTSSMSLRHLFLRSSRLTRVGLSHFQYSSSLTLFRSIRYRLHDIVAFPFIFRSSKLTVTYVSAACFVNAPF